MSRRSSRLLIVAVVLLVSGFTVRNLLWEAPPVPPVAGPSTGISCFRAGGDPGYCRCLDRLDSARDEAHLPASVLPPFDDPAVRFAMRHPQRYPVINADTPRCVVVPRPPSNGTSA